MPRVLLPDLTTKGTYCILLATGRGRWSVEVRSFSLPEVRCGYLLLRLLLRVLDLRSRLDGLLHGRVREMRREAMMRELMLCRNLLQRL